MNSTLKPSAQKPTSLLSRIAEPWTIVVFAMALFHFFRDAPIDGAFFLVLAPRHGVVEGLIVSAIGVYVLVTAWNTGATRSKGSDALRRSLFLFTAVGVIGCIIEVGSYLLGLPSAEAMFTHPSVSLLLDPFVDTTVGRIAFTGLWLLVGIWFLRRTSKRVAR